MRFRMTSARRLVLIGAAFGALAGCQSTEEPKPGPIVGAWPDVCSKTAGQLLDDIENWALAAKSGTTIEQYKLLLDRVLADVAKCRTNEGPCTLPDPSHYARVQAARDAAKAGHWGLCATELEHGH